MRTTVLLSSVIGLVLLNSSIAGAITMTFEEFLGQDAVPIATHYQGITFQSGYAGSDWVARDATSNNYNVSSWPSGQQWNGASYWMYDYVGATTALDYTGNDGVIAFDNQDATFVELGYCSGSQLYLLAYDSSDTLMAQTSGPANRRYVEGNESGPGTLRVDAPQGSYISYVNVHDTGNFWVVDNITTDASGIVLNTVPAPGAIVLGSIGMGLVGWLRRRRALA
jgi:hypothetical protein